MQLYNAMSAKKRKVREGFSMLAARSPSIPHLHEGEGRGVGINEAMASVLRSRMPFSPGQKERVNRCCIFNAQSAMVRQDQETFLLQQPSRSLRFIASFAL